ncbi:hypothetical protein [Diaphorobacter aerolatus]|uniref:Uncharacterized protein n=1 Tax=Diaphorobacter aerolatus TaxID=1288495 RepID=A0A7H0GIR4_9BURK|nr:hypothetical protein [Diaphorobacter aerolatus]QNP48180.1 hypothetical protein H9K75_19495 [Diaphorobacter aerolatus]
MTFVTPNAPQTDAQILHRGTHGHAHVYIASALSVYAKQAKKPMKSTVGEKSGPSSQK